jgi:hypothetical protein
MKQAWVMCTVLAMLAGGASAAIVVDDFDSGVLSGWSAESTYMTLTNVDSPTHQGAGALRITWQDWNQSWYENLYASFSAQDWSGADTLEIALMTGASATDYVYVSFRNGDTWGSAIGLMTLSQSQGEYVVYSLPLGMGERSNVTGLHFTWSGKWVDGASTIYLDSIRAVPEPMTLAMLAMGGVAMLRKRL